jgi:hypothetical protein
MAIEARIDRPGDDTHAAFVQVAHQAAVRKCTADKVRTALAILCRSPATPAKTNCTNTFFGL